VFCFAEPYLPQNEFELLNSVLGDGIHKDKEMGISTVTFDAHEELLWMGTKSGHVTTFDTLVNELDRVQGWFSATRPNLFTGKFTFTVHRVL
jgi:hypothetical protein